MSAACVVPWRGGCPYRGRAFSWLRERLPYPVRVGEGGEPFIKAHAVMPAIEASNAEIVIVHDADVFCPGLPDAVRAVQGGAAWSMPHRGVFRLTESATERFYEGAAWDSLPLEGPAYLGWEGGGCVVARRETLLDVPLDGRFQGWGGEDESWALALRALAGVPRRIKTPLVHLYHPPQERMSRRMGSPNNWELVRRYVAARRDPTVMRELIEEAKRDFRPDNPALHTESPVGVN